MFKIDVHVHTSEVSSCGRMSAADTVCKYKEAQYDGIVITDHYYKEYFDNIQEKRWKEKVERYLTGYYKALECGRREGIVVLPGMELRMVDSFNDYLIFGIDEKTLLELPEIYLCTPEELRNLTRENGLLIFQAHPFRPNLVPLAPELLDGIEVYNGNPRHNSRNELALEYAAKNKLRFLSGSDCHQVEDVGRGGIMLPKPVTTPKELVDALMMQPVNLIREGNYA